MLSRLSHPSHARVCLLRPSQILTQQWRFARRPVYPNLRTDEKNARAQHEAQRRKEQRDRQEAEQRQLQQQAAALHAELYGLPRAGVAAAVAYMGMIDGNLPRWLFRAQKHRVKFPLHLEAKLAATRVVTARVDTTRVGRPGLGLERHGDWVLVPHIVRPHMVGLFATGILSLCVTWFVCTIDVGHRLGQEVDPDRFAKGGNPLAGLTIGGVRIGGPPPADPPLRLASAEQADQ
eukprot:3231189-Prymnesium_polylepis.1